MLSESEMYVLSNRGLAELRKVLPKIHFEELSVLGTRPAATPEDLLRIAQWMLPYPADHPIYSIIMKNVEACAARPDFVFSRDKERDYHFVSQPEVDDQVLNAIVSLQDYFSSLIDGKGLYSFQKDKYWITSEIVQTSERDHVGRPIYGIRGNLHNVRTVGDKWFTFGLCEGRYRPKRSMEFPPGDYPATKESLSAFFQYCSASRNPFSWAYGVRRRGSDSSGLDFRVRFLRPEKESGGGLVSGFFQAIGRLLEPDDRGGW